MTKVIIRTGNVSSFFDRAQQAARRADQGGVFEEAITLSFEDPQQLFTVLSEARRRLMQEILHEAKTISELATKLKRGRAAITKDVILLEKMGLLVSVREPNPGHGIQKRVRAVASKIEMVAVLE